MNAIQIVFGSILIFVSFLVILLVAMQESKQGNVSAIQGGGDSHLDKGRTKTRDSRLITITKVLAIVFFILAFAVTLIANYFIA